MFILLLIIGIPLLKSLEILLPPKKNPFTKLLLLTGCGLLNGMVIFIGDLGNLLPTFIFFLICVLICCTAQSYPKLRSVLYLPVRHYPLMQFSITIFCTETLQYSFFGFYSGVFYLLLRCYAPEKGYFLYNSLWKLLLFLICLPLGIVTTIVLLSDPVNHHLLDALIVNFVLLLLALISFIGSLQASCE